MKFSASLLLTSALFVALSGSAAPAVASDNPAMDIAVTRVQQEWERIKYQTRDPRAQHAQIEVLARDAAAVTARYPGRAEPLIWQGIAESEHAAMSSGLSALSDAKASRRTFEMAYKLDRTALEAGAATSLGTLYYRVPGFGLPPRGDPGSMLVHGGF
jgi:hypothetical protein